MNSKRKQKRASHLESGISRIVNVMTYLKAHGPATLDDIAGDLGDLPLDAIREVIAPMEQAGMIEQTTKGERKRPAWKVKEKFKANSISPESLPENKDGWVWILQAGDGMEAEELEEAATTIAGAYTTSAEMEKAAVRMNLKRVGVMHLKVEGLEDAIKVREHAAARKAVADALEKVKADILGDMKPVHHGPELYRAGYDQSTADGKLLIELVINEHIIKNASSALSE